MAIDGVTLDTIGGGVLAELFAAELKRVVENIADPNTDEKTKRSIALTVTFKPNRDRDAAEVDIKCSSKLAGLFTVQSKVFMGRHNGKLVAVENDPRQSGLFDSDRPALAAVVGSFGKDGE